MADESKYRPTRYSCPVCKGDKGWNNSSDFRVHVRKYHPEISEIELERYMVGFRYPHVDIDRIVQRYVDRLETMMGLQNQGIFIKKYLQTLGVARDYRADLSLMGLHKRFPGLETPEDIRKAYERQLVGTFREASPEKRFEGYLNRENSKLEKAGQGDLIPAISTLKTIKFVKQRLQEALEPDGNPEEND